MRWYSPRDWLDEESSEDCPEPSTTSRIAAVDKQLKREVEEEEKEASTQLQDKNSISGSDTVTMKVGMSAVDDDGSGDGDEWDHEGWGEDDWDVVDDGNEEDERETPLSHEEDVKPAIRVRSDVKFLEERKTSSNCYCMSLYCICLFSMSKAV